MSDEFLPSWQSLEPFEVPNMPAIDPPRGDWSPVVDIAQDDSPGAPGISGSDGVAGPAGPTGTFPPFIASATALGTGVPPTATAFPTNPAPTIHLKLGIPAGAQGPPGPTGPPAVVSGYTGNVPFPFTSLVFANGLLQSWS